MDINRPQNLTSSLPVREEETTKPATPLEQNPMEAEVTSIMRTLRAIKDGQVLKAGIQTPPASLPELPENDILRHARLAQAGNAESAFFLEHYDATAFMKGFLKLQSKSIIKITEQDKIKYQEHLATLIALFNFRNTSVINMAFKTINDDVNMETIIAHLVEEAGYSSKNDEAYEIGVHLIRSLGARSFGILLSYDHKNDSWLNRTIGVMMLCVPSFINEFIWHYKLASLTPEQRTNAREAKEYYLMASGRPLYQITHKGIMGPKPQYFTPSPKQSPLGAAVKNPPTNSPLSKLAAPSVQGKNHLKPFGYSMPHLRHAALSALHLGQGWRRDRTPTHERFDYYRKFYKPSVKPVTNKI